MLVNRLASVVFCICIFCFAFSVGAEVIISDDPSNQSLSIDAISVKDRTVSIPKGEGDGVSRDDDFAILGPDDSILALIYPFQLYDNCFWSQPLTREDYGRVGKEFTVKRVFIDKYQHDAIRREGAQFYEEFLAKGSVTEQNERQKEVLSKAKATVIDLNMQQKYPQLGSEVSDKYEVKGFSHATHAFKYMVGNQSHSSFPYEDLFTCPGCHHTAKTPEKTGACLSCKDMLNTMGGQKKEKLVFHKVCRACHISLADAAMDTGPYRCGKGSCHPTGND